ncbi:glycoside hydrolase family 5 [Fusarium acutatum]|uniref:Glycoside hydrolase family 5 n=1 Tax=Fusarium acutatum TaxID=78861 RepID=A0A8H4NP41_9HYPO|nr:glycoside hydrolase family 5 [Fusarium acutatum]
MKRLFTTLCLALTHLSQLTEAKSGSWSGTNNYFLQGMSDSAQDAYIQTLSSYNTKVVRLWVNQASKGCQKGSQIVRDIPQLETTIGQYNKVTLDEIDKLLVKLSDKNIKAIISPHDANSLIGDYRKDAYWARWGSGYFYEKQDAFDAYDARLSYILNYKGAYSGEVWKNWPHAIFSFNLQNEPMTPGPSNCKNGDPSGWACGRATFMRNAGLDSRILISTGGLGGDFSHGCTFLPAVTQCKAIDAISVHRYASVPGKWSANLPSWLSQANGKKVYLEEWGVDSQKYDQKSAFVTEVNDMNSVGLPNMYWQLLPPSSGGCSYNPKNDAGDPFGIYTNSGANLAGPINGATSSGAAQDWTGKLGNAAFSAADNSDMSLRVLLESKNIPKMGFDIRGISRILFHQFHVSLAGVHDIQLMELASRKGGQTKKFLSGLANCIDQDISNEDPDKVRWLNPTDAKDLQFYQDLGHAPYWIMKRVEIFPSLWEAYYTKLNKPKNAVWLHLAEQESEQRVHDAKKKRKKARTEKQSWGPEVFWDDQQKQIAKEAWNKSIMLNKLLGDLGIGRDDE